MNARINLIQRRLQNLLGYHPEGFPDDSQPYYKSWSPLLLLWRVRHRLTGPQRGCSCTRCFYHPKRRVPAREFYKDRQRIAELERKVR